MDIQLATKGEYALSKYIALENHPTPKINTEDGTAYTLNSRDYKGVMIVVLSESDRPTDGE